MIRFASIKLWQAVSIDFLKLFISKISQLNIALHCEYCLHWHSKLSIYFNIVLLSNSNFDRVYLSIKKRRGCHGDAKRWHLHIYIAKRRNVIIYSCHLAVFVKGSVLTRSNSLVSHLRPKWAALKCVFLRWWRPKPHEALVVWQILPGTKDPSSRLPRRSRMHGKGIYLCGFLFRH